MPNVPVVAIVGIGPGNGGSLTRKFAEEGYQVAMLSRAKESFEQYEREIDQARGFVCDAADAQSVERAFAEVRQDLGDVDVLIYNAGAGTWGDLEEVSADAFEACWRVNALGLFHCAKAVVGPMVEKNAGAIAVIGASAAWRGRAGTLAFAQAKAAQRSTAQSLARRYGPDGIHVAYLVIDGVVDLPRAREHMPAKPDDFFLNPDHIALTVYNIVHQPRSAWSFEVDVRPHIEDW